MIKVAGVLLVSYKSQAAKDLSVIKSAGVEFANSWKAWSAGLAIRKPENVDQIYADNRMVFALTATPQVI